MATFYPADNAVNISPVKPTITVTFDSAVFSAFAEAGTVFTDATLKEAFAFKKTDADGADVPCVMNISEDNKVVTITPTEELVDTQVYYVAILANKVFTAADTKENAAAADWTVGIVTGTAAKINTVTSATPIALNIDETAFKVDCADEGIVMAVYNSSADTAYDVTILAPVEGQYAATDENVTTEVDHGQIAFLTVESARYIDKKGRLRIKGENAALICAFFKKS